MPVDADLNCTDVVSPCSELRGLRTWKDICLVCNSLLHYQYSGVGGARRRGSRRSAPAAARTNSGSASGGTHLCPRRTAPRRTKSRRDAHGFSPRVRVCACPRHDVAAAAPPRPPAPAVSCERHRPDPVLFSRCSLVDDACRSSVVHRGLYITTSDIRPYRTVRVRFVRYL
ncbi:hypothetical protein EVAR_103712_1 [Eumeta japonica]|uniref:Uncharacterized protein n=1 Tax=Eumeta variegata TaxID=151549 RepID=A0A4C1ZMR1_EUMVA|nr:hypothetical protein EVAR_103712_1 [Eumeta japonica]